MDEAYEDGVKATVKQHISNLHDVLREMVNCNDEEFAEHGYIIEEVGRFIDKLYEEYNDDDEIEVFYHDGLNCFGVKGEE